MSGAVSDFLNGDPVVVDLGRKLGCASVLARLGQNQVGVGIRFDIEIYDQRRLRVGRGV